MSGSSSSLPVRIAIIGAGAVSDYHHVPGIALHPRAKLVAVCDADPVLLEKRRHDWNVDLVTTDAEDLCAHAEVDAVIIATPNFTHRSIAVAAARNGKHVMCEKPLGLNAGEVRQMYEAARDAKVVHMTAFTYRFAPSMRYMKHLVASGVLGTPRHFRSQRFLDWPETSWGWRQYKDKAGAGDLFDMTIHRIDFALDLMGPLKSVCGAVAQFVPRTKTTDGRSCPASEVDDWSSLIGEFASGAVGVWEGTTLAKGYHRDGFGHEWAEVNGSEGSAVYRLHEPNTILLGSNGHDLAPVSVPEQFLKPVGSPRDPSEGKPATVFRYDLVWEFVSAILERREAVPSFYDGLSAQVIADAVLDSFAQRRWLDIPKCPVEINAPLRKAPGSPGRCWMASETDTPERSPLRSLMGVQVVATGSYVPDLVVRNEDLQERLGFDPAWILQRTGIRERRFARPEQATSDLAVIAAERCLARAGVKPSDVDLVIVGTFTPDMSFPSTACLVQNRLGIRAPAFDVQAACAGFMFAMITGMQYVASGCSQTALIIGADTNSRILNPKDQRTYPLFGDGAGAVLLARGSPQQGLVSYTLGADGSGADLLSRPLGGSRFPFNAELLSKDLHYMQMDGRAVFKWAIHLLDDTVRDVLRASRLSVDQIDLVVLHQANVRIINAAVDVLGIDRKKVVVNLDRFGNTSAGSVPLALDEAFDQGRVKRGHRILLSGFGAGLAWGTAILHW